MFHSLSSLQRLFPILLLALSVPAFLLPACQEVAGSLPATGQAASSSNSMASVMETTRKKMYNYKNSFCAEAKLAYADSIIQNTQDPAQKVKMMFYKAAALLEFGDETKSVALYEDILSRTNLDTKSKNQVLLSLGTAYLRLGERNNCVNNHTAEACIMPIQGSGVHQDRTGSQKAYDTFLAILKTDPGNLDARWLLNLAAMTLGEYPRKVDRAMLIPGLDARDAQPVKPFSDVATSLGLATNNRSGGSIVDDFDNDGYLDVVTSAWALDDPMHYFHNNGDGTFTDRSAPSGLHAITGGLNLTQADYNNDGHLDILVLRGAWQGMIGFGEQPNSLLRNNGDGTFTDVTIEAGMLSYHPTQTATWNDFNNDGWLDVVIANESTGQDAVHPCEFYINNQNGTFTNIVTPANLQIIGFFKGVISGDFDNDGWPDLFFSNLAGQKLLLRNRGVRGAPVAFDDVSKQAGFGDATASTFTTWFWDYDNDGWLDIFACNYDFGRALSFYAAKEALQPSADMAGKPYFYHNNGDGTFTNVTTSMHANKTVFAMGGNFGDIDNDGWLDMYLGTGNPDYKSLLPNRMFRNVGGKGFSDVTASARVGNLQKGHGVSMADIDNDGDQDIHIDMGGAYRSDAYPSSLFLNPGQNNNHWINMKLVGNSSNRSAIGVKVLLTFREKGKPRQIYREVNAGGNFGCSPLRREIGIGSATSIDEVRITWPASGRVQVLKDVKADQFIRITEGQDGFEAVALNKLPIKKGNSSIPMCTPAK